MDCIEIISEYYPPGSPLFEMFLDHGKKVAQKALLVARSVQGLSPDLEFVEEAALLHDIGIFMTDAKKIGCIGRYPYICHGFLGREILEEKGLPRHALVCERHVGVGISAEDILESGLPLPVRDMRPKSIEEKIICYADKFYSKAKDGRGKEKPVKKIIGELTKFGPERAEKFRKWGLMFNATD